MRIKDMPEWVLQHKSKGYTVRYQANKYILLKVSSKRKPDKPYPVLEQTVIGTITPEGIVPKKVSLLTEEKRIEYGLSIFIYKNLYSELNEIIHFELTGSREQMIVISIMGYIFKSYDEKFIELSHLPIKTNISNYKNISDRRIKNIKKMGTVIENFFNTSFINENEKKYFIESLRNITIGVNQHPSNVFIPDKVKEIIEIKGFKYAF